MYDLEKRAHAKNAINKCFPAMSVVLAVIKESCDMKTYSRKGTSKDTSCRWETAMNKYFKLSYGLKSRRSIP